MLTQTLCRMRAVRTSFPVHERSCWGFKSIHWDFFFASLEGYTVANLKLRKLHEMYYFCSHSTSWTDTRMRNQFILPCPAKEKQTKTSFWNCMCFWHFLAILWSFTVRSLNIFSLLCCCLKDTYHGGSLTGKQVVTSLAQSDLCRPVPRECCGR